MLEKLTTGVFIRPKIKAGNLGDYLIIQGTPKKCQVHFFVAMSDKMKYSRMDRVPQLTCPWILYETILFNFTLKQTWDVDSVFLCHVWEWKGKPAARFFSWECVISPFLSLHAGQNNQLQPSTINCVKLGEGSEIDFCRAENCFLWRLLLLIK